MYIPKISTVPFKAICKGQYEDLKKIAMDNGEEIDRINNFEKNIQKSFPENNQILKFKILGSPVSFNDICIHLTDREGAIIQDIEGTVIPRNINQFNEEEKRKEKSLVFEKVAKLVRKLGKKYTAQLNNEQEKFERDAKLNAAKNASHKAERSFKCIISNDVNVIKNISIAAGYSRDKAVKLYDLIKKIFSNNKYDFKTFYLNFGEDEDSTDRRYVVYHGLADANVYYVPEIKTPISSGVTTEDRKLLFEKLYRLIKSFY